MIINLEVEVNIPAVYDWWYVASWIQQHSFYGLPLTTQINSSPCKLRSGNSSVADRSPSWKFSFPSTHSDRGNTDKFCCTVQTYVLMIGDIHTVSAYMNLEIKQSRKPDLLYSSVRFKWIVWLGCKHLLMSSHSTLQRIKLPWQ